MDGDTLGILQTANLYANSRTLYAQTIICSNIRNIKYPVESGGVEICFTWNSVETPGWENKKEKEMEQDDTLKNCCFNSYHWLKWLIYYFNVMTSCVGLCYALKLGKCVYSTGFNLRLSHTKDSKNGTWWRFA